MVSCKRLLYVIVYYLKTHYVKHEMVKITYLCNSIAQKEIIYKIQTNSSFYSVKKVKSLF